VEPPRSAAGRRTVTLPAVVVEALAEHLARYTATSPEAYVFLSSQGRHLRRSNFNRRVWQPATQAAGVEGLRVHDLRHTAGTLATAAGGSLREVMDRLRSWDRTDSGPIPRRWSVTTSGNCPAPTRAVRLWQPASVAAAPWPRWAPAVPPGRRW
jgi:integrase